MFWPNLVLDLLEPGRDPVRGRTRGAMAVTILLGITLARKLLRAGGWT